MLLELGRGVVAVEDEVVIGTALGAEFGPSLAVANMIIVDAAHQGKGLGRKLMEAVLPRAGACRLVATAEGLPLYKKLGFAPTGQILQFQGSLRAPAPGDATRSATPGELDQIAALEGAAYGGDRRALVALIQSQSPLFVSEDAKGQITGYAAQRRFGRGHVIGPVAAPDLATAQALIAAAMQGLDGAFVRVDTDAQAGLGAWLTAAGLEHVGGGVAMQRGTAALPSPRYALFSQALG